MRLYHYTDLLAVKSILTEKNIRFTDLRYLNDSSELRDGISVLVEAFEKWRGSLWAVTSHIEEAKEYIKGELDDRFSEESHFACSFSRAYDQLSQWRTYGKYVIEFDQELLSKDLQKLHDCVYKKKAKQGIALTTITTAVEVVSTELSKNGSIGLESLDQIANLYDIAATFKNEGFREEDEVRALIKTDDADDNIKYRARADLLIPYLEVPITLDSVKAVHIGPMQHQDLAFNSMWGFVQSIVRSYQQETGNIEFEIDVSTSSIPLRTL